MTSLRTRLILAVTLGLVAAACSPSSGPTVVADAEMGLEPLPTLTTLPATTTTAELSNPSSSTTLPATTTTTTNVPRALTGTVTTVDGTPLPDAVVANGGSEVRTDAGGRFRIEDPRPGIVAVSKPAWVGATEVWDGEGPLTIVLRPFVVRAIRVAGDAAGDRQRFGALLDMATRSNVNTLVFDTKSESGTVHYATRVDEAVEIGAVKDHYDPREVLAAARSRGLYTITRIVSFEDPIRSRARPELKLAGTWVDPANSETWTYPLALAEEACLLGFDEIQLDYVRFPTGITAASARSRDRIPDEEGRVATIAAYLAEAKRRLHDMGCALSADIFAIVLSTSNDQGIGQRPSDLAPVVDALSPMIYPSHYSPGWLGFDDPNAHPAAVTGGALDDGAPKVGPETVVRPWLQAFYWSASQIGAAIEAAEQRNHGWMLWNAGSNYAPEWLPERPRGRTVLVAHE